MSVIEPTNCCLCNKDLSEGFRCDQYKGDQIVASYCYRCDNDRIFDEYLKNHRLNTKFMMQNMSELYHLSKDLKDQHPYFRALYIENQYAEILNNPIHLATWINLTHNSKDFFLKERLKAYAAVKKIESRIAEFETKVWYGGLQKQIRASTKKGVSAKMKLGKVEYAVLTYSMCGRTMITFDLPDCSVTAITVEDESDRSYMGIQGVDATPSQALELIDIALSAWETGELIFKDDTKVGLGLPF